MGSPSIYVTITYKNKRPFHQAASLHENWSSMISNSLLKREIVATRI